MSAARRMDVFQRTSSLVSLPLVQGVSVVQLCDPTCKRAIKSTQISIESCCLAAADRGCAQWYQEGRRTRHGPWTEKKRSVGEKGHRLLRRRERTSTATSKRKDIDCYVGEKGHRLLRRRERTSTATSERKDIDCYVFTSSCLHLRHLEKRLSLQERNLYSQEMLLCGTLIAIDKLHFEIDGCQ